MAQIELDIQIDDNPIERLTDAIQTLTDKISNVSKVTSSSTKSMEKDFDDVDKSVKEVNKDTRLQNTLMGSLGKNAKTTLSSMSQGWKGAATATKGFGMALKATGIGLLIAILVPIIDAFKDFIGELEIVQIYLEMVGAVLKVVSDALNWLTGLLFKNRKATDDLIESNKKLQEERDNNWAKQEQNINNEIALLKAQGAEIEEIRKKEMELAIQRAENAKENLKANKDEIKYLESQGKLSKKQKERLKELKEITNDLTLAYENSTAQIDILAASQKTAREKDADDKAKQDAKDADDAKNKARQAYKDKLAAEKQYNQDRLVAKRLNEDLEISMIEDATEKEIELNRLKYERLIEDATNNEKLTQEEKLKIIEQYQDIQTQKDEEIKEKKRLADEQKEKDDLKKAQQTILKVQELERSLEEQRIQELEEFSEERNQRELQLQKDKYDAQLLALQEQLDNELISQEEFELQKEILKNNSEEAITAINKKYSDERVRIEEEETEQKKALQKAVANAGVSAASSLLGAMSELAEEGSEEAKKLAIAQVTVDTIMGGIAAMSQSIAQLGPIAGPIVGGVLAAGIAASGVSAIQKIKSTKKDSTSSASSTNIRVATPNTNNTPNINLYGSNNNDNNVYSNDNRPNNEPSKQEPIRAVVSWTDIDAVSKSDSQLRNQMAL